MQFKSLDDVSTDQPGESHQKFQAQQLKVADMLHGFLALCCLGAVGGAQGTKVAVLAAHNPAKCGSSGSQAVVECNLKVSVHSNEHSRHTEKLS